MDIANLTRRLGIVLINITLLGITVSCARQGSNLRESCANYIRAYAEDANLDSAGADVERALDDDSVNSLKQELDDYISAVDEQIPGLPDAWSSSSEQARLVELYGEEAIDAFQGIASRFVALDLKIRERCDALVGPVKNNETTIP